MRQRISYLFLLLAAATLARAHFVFVVPEAGGAKAKVIMSEDLKPSQEVAVSLFAGTRLILRAGDGAETPLEMVRGDHAYDVALSGSGTRVIHGLTDFGVMQRGAKAHVLLCYAKTILGDPFDEKTIVGGQVPVEIVPGGKSGAVTLKLLARGKPIPNAEINVILPDGRQVKVKTDAGGQTEAFAEHGRYGAWARFWESDPGERGGKKYEELRHYATLVFDSHPAASRIAALPQAASSFGAVASDGWLYVYGGHISPTHTYWLEAVSGKFHRLRLADGKWEALASGPPLQGLNLTAYQGRIYRIGGMAPRNKRGDAADNHSTAECARFDPATGVWEPLPPLAQGRSSHDVVVVGSRMIVTGGWTMAGQKEEWVDTLAVMDLATERPEWSYVPQPFRRRALIAAAYRDKLYVIGGFNQKNQIVSNVSIYDPAAGAWSEGAELPAGVGLAFAPAALVHGGSLYVSVSDGTLLRLDESRGAWVKSACATPRVAHRLAAYDGKVLVIGGAADGKNFDLIEALAVR